MTSTAQLCKWEESKCTPNPSGIFEKYWYDSYGECKDTEKLCRTQNVNDTYKVFTLEFPEEVANDLVEDWLPENYFCKFT